VFIVVNKETNAVHEFATETNKLDGDYVTVKSVRGYDITCPTDIFDVIDIENTALPDLTYGWLYINKNFVINPDSLEKASEELKQSAIVQTKAWIDRELENGMVWVDGKTYTITREKQSLLTGQLMLGAMAQAQGLPDEKNILSWNATGEESTDWQFGHLYGLAYSIQEYVKPMVKKQQKAEVEISQAASVDEVQEILKEFI